MAAEDMPLTWLDQRELEMAAGRARIQEREGQLKANRSHAEEIRREEARKQEEEDNNRLAEARDGFISNRVELDRAGAEVADQAQTELEATQHTADRKNKVIDREHENMIEALDHPDVDTALAESITRDVVTAQAVNQPTILANNRGVDTETKPLNVTKHPVSGGEWEDDALALDRQVKPSDATVPKTRPKAEKVAKGKVPPVKQVVKQDFEPDAVKIVRATDDDILGEGREI